MSCFLFPLNAVEESGAGEDASASVKMEDEVVPIPLLIEALGDDSFSVRQQATHDLWRRGEEVIPALKKATQSSDPEMVDRAAELLLYISAGVLYDSPEDVKSMVLHYFAGGADAKLKILKKLTQRKQWRQVLHLASMEKDPKVLLKINALVQATVKRAAQEALLAGDVKLLNEVLRLGGESDQALIIRAWFALCHGDLKRELAKAATMDGDLGVKWSLALHRVSGDLEGAIRDAKKLDRRKLLAAFQILGGDPRPWLKEISEKSLQDEILSLDYEIQMARLDGDFTKAKSLVNDLVELAQDEDSASRVISGLSANGYPKEALRLLERYDVEAAFDYYDSTESPELALKMFDIPADAKPPYAEWVKTFTERVLSEEKEDLYDRLLMVAGFLLTHGEDEHVVAVLTPLMSSLEKDGSDSWFDLIGKMPLYGLSAQAVYFLEKRGNEDGEIELGVYNLLDSGRAVKHIWAALLKMNKQDAVKSLHQIALLAGMLPDPKKETDAINQALLDGVAGKLPAEQKLRQESVFAFAIKRHEIVKASKMVDEFAKKDPKGRWKRTKLFLDTALQRWKKVEPIYAELAKETPGDYFNLLKWSICLRKLGKEKRAQEMLDRALLLSMGDALTIASMGVQLSEAGYSEEAFDLLKKSLMMVDPESEAFNQVLLLINSLNPRLGPQTWKGGAALAEALSRLTMQGRSTGSILSLLGVRFQADFYRGMNDLKEGRKKQGIEILDFCRKLNPGSGSLADDFFPALRTVNVGKRYDQWFEDGYQHLEAACKRFPRAHNTHNTTAWLAARALRKLDGALVHAQTAIKLRPYQSAYFDTMAEVYFARGDRQKAVEWSKKAIELSFSHAQGNPRSEAQVLSNYYELNKQLQRFQTAPLPKANR